jgi:hypothetical protein
VSSLAVGETSPEPNEGLSTVTARSRYAVAYPTAYRDLAGRGSGLECELDRVREPREGERLPDVYERAVGQEERILMEVAQRQDGKTGVAPSRGFCML